MGERPSESHVLFLSIAVLGVIWVSLFVLVLPWFSLLAHYTGQYLLLGVFVQQSLAVLDDHVNLARIPLRSSW